MMPSVLKICSDLNSHVVYPGFRAALFHVSFTLNQNSIASPLILGAEVGQTRFVLGLLLCGIASLDWILSKHRPALEQP